MPPAAPDRRAAAPMRGRRLCHASDTSKPARGVAMTVVSNVAAGFTCFERPSGGSQKM
jgi:hypothetical protein